MTTGLNLACLQAWSYLKHSFVFSLKSIKLAHSCVGLVSSRHRLVVSPGDPGTVYTIIHMTACQCHRCNRPVSPDHTD